MSDFSHTPVQPVKLPTAFWARIAHILEWPCGATWAANHLQNPRFPRKFLSVFTPRAQLKYNLFQYLIHRFPGTLFPAL